jgi:hypothetical protein
MSVSNGSKLKNCDELKKEVEKLREIKEEILQLRIRNSTSHQCGPSPANVTGKGSQPGEFSNK